MGIIILKIKSNKRFLSMKVRILESDNKMIKDNQLTKVMNRISCRRWKMRNREGRERIVCQF